MKTPFQLADRFRPVRGRIRHSGFTLVELLIAMMIGLVVLGAVCGLFTVQQKQLASQEKIAEMQQNVRMAMDMMSRELKMAGYNPAGMLSRCAGTSTAVTPACSGIVTARSDSVGFTVDLNGNGVVTPYSSNPNENIAYSVYTTAGVWALGRTANGARLPLVENITTIGLTYYDESGTVTANLTGIRRIQLSITGQTSGIDVTSGQIKTFNLTANVMPENLSIIGGI